MKKVAILLIFFLYSAVLTPERVSAQNHDFSFNDRSYCHLSNSLNYCALQQNLFIQDVISAQQPKSNNSSCLKNVTAEGSRLISLQNPSERKHKDDPYSLFNRSLESALIEIARLDALGEYEVECAALLYCNEIYPNNDVINYLLSQFYYIESDYDKALNYIIIADSLCNDNVWYISLMANIYYRREDYSDAADCYARSVELDPYSNSFYLMAAVSFTLSDDYIRAYDYYTRFEETFGFSSNILSEKFDLMTYSYLENDLEVRNQLIKNEADITLESGARPLSDVTEIARSLYGFGFEEEAKKFLNDYIERHNAGALYFVLAYFNYTTWNREEFEHYWNLGLLETQDSADDILYIAKEIYKRFQHDQRSVAMTEYVVDMGLQMREEDIELVERVAEQQDVLTLAFEQLKDSYPNTESTVMFYCDWLNLIGSPLYLSSLKDYLHQFTNEYYVYQEFLLKYTDKGDADTTLYYSLQCIENFPDKPLPYFSAAVAYIGKDDYDSALEILLRGVEEASDVSPLTGELYSLLGECYHKRGENAKAYEAYDTALSFDANDFQVLNNYAYYLSLDGIDLSKAESMSYSVVRNYPNNATYLDTYAWVLYREGKFEEARVAMERALENMGDEDESGLYYEHYGDILEALGEHEEALLNWRKALEFPDDIDVDTLKAKIRGAGK